jgi:hypothetical protein
MAWWCANCHHGIPVQEPPHVCVPPDQTKQFIPTGSVWWCLKCDEEWVLERKGGWKKWRKRP